MGHPPNYSYDNLSRLLSVLHQVGSTTLDGASYTYDNAGNRMSKTDYLASVTSNYAYDNLYQLTQVTQGSSTTESYSYDSVGNRLSSLGVSPYAYNSSNELTSTPSTTYTYDHNGNTTSKTDSSGTTTYNWNSDNQLTSVVLPASGGTVSFKYDPFGRRVQKSSGSGTVDYVYDGANIFEEVDNSGNILARYTQGRSVDAPLAMLRSSSTSYYEGDGLGSITSLSNSGGTIANTYTYDSYGRVALSTGVVVNSLRYTARDADLETGLYYYRARYFDQNTGRFISEDPIHFEGGVNFFTYVANNPLLFTDPTGLKKCKGPLPCDPKNLRLVPTRVETGNHSIYYTLMTADGKPAPGRWYVYEHQTQTGGGRTNYGPGDNVSPVDSRGEGNLNAYDDLLTTWLDSVQSFSISLDPSYDPNCQYPVIIRYGDGKDYASQHLWQRGGFDPVMINNYPTLPAKNR